ncbi:hypothetical protein JW886_09775 [Lactococcus taiwanensis]|uniref:Internalin n=1 Tax=Lactococcus taiwanensis TaxID=1151742 RepID=A0AA45KI79_9LACT|nr:hypothetical protein [Lactococcus taiwanensis]QSE76716.1 hypothetical protein JW886_09775 [Lactococcus taiwanensis]
MKKLIYVTCIPILAGGIFISSKQILADSVNQSTENNTTQTAQKAPELQKGGDPFEIGLMGANGKASSTTSKTSQDEDVITMDSALEQAVKAALGLSDSEAITTDNILNLTELRTKGAGIKDLSGLEYATNLKVVTFDGEAISSLTPLENLTQLYSVGVPNCSNLSIQEVLRLKHITALDLSGNKYSQDDFNNLSVYKDMTVLWLNDCGLTSTSFMSEMNHLNNLSVNNNSLSSLEGVATNESLALQVKDNNLTSLDFNKFPNIYVLNADDNDLSELNGLDTVPLNNLTALYLFNNNLSTDLYFQNISQLETLDLGSNPFSKLVLQNLPKLSMLYIEGSQLTNLNDWANLPLLQNVDLAFSQDLQDISELTQFNATITQLSLNGCTNIKDFRSIENLSALEMLLLDNMNLTDDQISEVGSLPYLTGLGVNGNQLSNINFVKQFPKMTDLDIRKNRILDLSNMPTTITKYLATDQLVDLAETNIGMETFIPLKDTQGNIPEIKNIVGEGEYTSKDDTGLTFIWNSVGENSFDFASADGNFTGTVKQTVTN